MKKLFISAVLMVLSISIFAQSGMVNFKYEVRAPSIRIGGANKVRLDSIVSRFDTLKFYSAGTELFPLGSGIWSGTGINMDTTQARATLRIDQVPNLSLAAMFNEPTFTGITNVQHGILPTVSGAGYLGSTTMPWGNIYMRTASSINWDNGDVVLSGQSNKLYLTGASLDLGANNLELTGTIGTNIARSNHGYFSNLSVTNTITGTASDVSGFIKGGGSLRLSGADSLRFNTLGITNLTLPLSGTLVTTSSPSFTGIVTAGTSVIPASGVGATASLGSSTNRYQSLYMLDGGALQFGDHDNLIFGQSISDSTKLTLFGGSLLIASDGAGLGSLSAPVDNAYIGNIFADTVSMINLKFLPTVGLSDTLATKAGIGSQINDSISDLVASASYAVSLADSNIYNGYTTRTFVESLLGSGSGLSAERLPFIIGSTPGAPAASDSTVSHSNFAGKHIDVYRNGAKQYQNFTATNTVDGFRMSGSTITVHPAWQANEQVLVDIIQPILWSYLSLEGEESSLLTGLSAYWKFDESSGTSLTDAVGVQNATLYNGSLSSDSKLGRSVQINDSTEYIRVPYNTNVSPKGTAFSMSMWIKLDTLPSVAGRDYYLFQQNNTSAPWGPHNAQINMSDNKIEFNTSNTSGTEYTVFSSGALSINTWYHIVFVNRGNGQTLQVYVNGSDVSSAAETFTGTIYEGLSMMAFGNPFSDGIWWMNGVMDEIGIWSVALTAGNVTTLYNSGFGRTHPF